MADDTKTTADGAADQTRQAPPADDQQQEPAENKITAEADVIPGKIKVQGEINAYLPGTENPAADMIRAVAEQEAEDVNPLLDFVIKLDTEEIITDMLTHLRALTEELKDLEPYLETLLENPEYKGKSFMDLKETTENGTTLFAKLIQDARAAFEADAKTNQLQQVSYKKGTDIKTVTDKLVNVFFSMTAPQPRGTMNGQRQFIPVRYEKQGAKKEITLFYDYSFNEDVIKRFGLSKEFDDQAFFVASIVDNLLDEGNTAVSATKIWHELGNTGSPSADAITNLVNILRLGMSTIITADISQVGEAWELEKDGKTREIISPVIPVQIAQEKFISNGKTASALINITGHTPFYLIGYPLDHFTTWKKDVLRLYKGRRTKRYYSVLRFLITQIGWMRNPKSKRSNKILYASLYDYTGDKTTRAQQLTRDMMYRLLDEVFIPTGYITAYKEDSTGKPGVLLKYTRSAKKLTRKKK